MKRLEVVTFILLTALLQSCERNVNISQKVSMYNTKVHITSLTETDLLPAEVKSLLVHENLMTKNTVKFTLAYYLIQEEDIKVLYSPNFDRAIVSQLYLEVSGTKYYKLFVHPDLDTTYSFLQHAYRYIGPQDTEFMATPTSAQKTMVVWDKGNRTPRHPFVVRTNLDGKSISIGNARVPASVLADGVDSMQMIFYRPIKGTKEHIEGQQVTEVPEFVPNK